MNGGKVIRSSRIRLAPPRHMGRLFGCNRVNELVLGDSALAAPPLLEAFVYYAEKEGLARVDFWGRAARFHADRAREILKSRRSAPEINAYARFEPIDLMEDAATMTRTAVSAFVVLDPEDPLEARLITSLQNEAPVAAVS